MISPSPSGDSGGPIQRRPLEVAIVDDYPLVVEGLQRMLEPYDERVLVRVVDGDTVVAPGTDLALVDPASDRGAEPVDLAEVSRRAGCERVVAYSWDLGHGLVRSALAAGAAGYLGKRLSASALVGDLERLDRGERVVTPNGSPVGPTRLDQVGLTRRESEVIALIADGHSNQDIADRSFLSINSVKSYIRSSYRKMGVSTRSQAVLWGVEHGLRPHRTIGPVDPPLD